MTFATCTFRWWFVILFLRLSSLLQLLLIDLEQLLLSRVVDETFSTLAKDVSFQQRQFVLQFLDQLLL